MKKGDTVTLSVAVAAQVQVPAGLSNTTLANAQQLLQQAGLVAMVKYVTNNAAKDTVLDASPASNTTVPAGTTVTLTVSSGPAGVAVPSLAGQTQTQAGQVLGSDGLVVGNITSQSSTQFAANLVISSNPPTGTLVPPGTAVDIVVSTGPPPTTLPPTTVPPTTTPTTQPQVSVPSLSGLSPSLANSALMAVGLTGSGSKGSASQCFGNSGNGVFAQNPSAGVSVSAGSPVTYSYC